MKLLGKILLGIILAIVAAVVFALWRASSARAADRAFHAALARSAVLKSESFSAGGDIPAAFTCKGAGASPELSWDATPENAQSYVLIVMDWDVPSPSFRVIGFTHWILYNVPRAVHEVK